MKKAVNCLKLIIFIGIMIILGTAGASDLGRLEIRECISSLLSGALLIVGGTAGLRLIAIVKELRQKSARAVRRTNTRNVRRTSKNFV